MIHQMKRARSFEFFRMDHLDHQRSRARGSRDDTLELIMIEKRLGLGNVHNRRMSDDEIGSVDGHGNAFVERMALSVQEVLLPRGQGTGGAFGGKPLPGPFTFCTA